MPCAAVVDIDILSSIDDLEKLYESVSGEQIPAPLVSIQREIALHIENATPEDILKAVTADVGEFLEQLKRGDHNLSGARGALNRITKTLGKWSMVKQGGIAALPEDFAAKAGVLLEELEKKGLFAVPVGELESWIKLDTTKKNRWIVKALEALFAGNCPEPLKKFVFKVLHYLTPPLSRGAPDA